GVPAAGALGAGRVGGGSRTALTAPAAGALALTAAAPAALADAATLAVRAALAARTSLAAGAAGAALAAAAALAATGLLALAAPAALTIAPGLPAAALTASAALTAATATALAAAAALARHAALDQRLLRLARLMGRPALARGELGEDGAARGALLVVGGGAPGLAHQVVHVALLVRGLHGDDRAGLAGARGAARAVQVGLVLDGRVGVDHESDLVHVDAARGDVGADHRRR